MKEVKIEETWDKKKILLLLVILAILAAAGYGLRTGISSKINNAVLNKGKSPSYSPSVKGIATQENSAAPQNGSLPNLQTALSGKLEALKQEAGSINISEIATSSPQIQKIINDIKSLQGYPQSQAKDICLKICGGL